MSIEKIEYEKTDCQGGSAADKPLVSICCLTYNHEPYIRDALEGFLKQKVTFPYEILIYYDASTAYQTHSPGGEPVFQRDHKPKRRF